MLEDRLIQGIELYEYEISDRLLMSGDHGRKDYDEVNVMKNLQQIEEYLQNMFLWTMLDFQHMKVYIVQEIFLKLKIIIVTQEYHLYRALYIADKLGIEAYGVPSDRRVYYGQKYREIREAIARVKDFFFVIFQPEPTYLGETIPISGNGDLTND